MRCPLAFLPNELCPPKCKSLGLNSETPSCKIPTNLTVDRCSVQSQALECLNCTHILLLFPLFMLFTAKGIYLNQVCSGFEPESPVHFRTLTWKAGNNLTVGRCSVQSQALECLNCTHKLLLFPLFMLFTAKGIYLNQACSGFEPESPVHFRTLTWKAGNTFCSILHSSLPFISFFFFGGRGTGRESMI